MTEQNQTAHEAGAYAILREIDCYSLVIESAVRHADPGNHNSVVAILQKVREVLS